ncbi:MAG: FtsQ-type POTRA domain-containing protein [Chloroflexi bacterium]|nr:FtsQ-type POTRA domain-containing protein [Chloroflexota bacterium]
MSTRARDRQRRNKNTGTRAPGVWRGPLAAPESTREDVEHGVRPRGMSWRLVSAAIVVLLLVVLVLFFTFDAFYVRSIRVGGLRYLTVEEVFALSGIVVPGEGNQHLFWLDPEAIRYNILRSPGIADAQVRIDWPPNMVEIIIQEREPALVWEQGGVAVWLDVHGRVMRQREDRPDLLRISAQGEIDENILDAGARLDQDIVTGALQLQELLPDLTMLRYDAVKGLGFQDPRGWEVWFGVGTEMPDRVLIYQDLANDLVARGIQPGEINFAGGLYYTVLWGR